MIDINVYASGSSGNCYVLSNDHSSIMLDCGLPLREIKEKLNFNLPRAVLVTHEHQDHAKAVKDLIKLGIDCYMTDGTAKELGVSGHRIKIIQAKQMLDICGFKVSIFDTQHDAAEPVGFIVEDDDDKVLYATDTYYIKYNFIGLTKIMVECNHSYEILNKKIKSGELNSRFSKRLLKSHFSLENLKEFLKANDLSKVKEIYLIHLSNGNADEKLFEKEIAMCTGLPVFVV